MGDRSGSATIHELGIVHVVSNYNIRFSALDGEKIHNAYGLNRFLIHLVVEHFKTQDISTFGR